MSFAKKNKSAVFHHILFFSLSLFIILSIVLPGYLLAAESNPAPKNIPRSKTAANPYDVNGYLSLKYVYRATTLPDERASDQDLFGELRFDLTMPKENRYEFHFFGTGRMDVDGNRDRRNFYPFEDIGDTYKSSVVGYLYEAHFDLNNPLSRVAQVRVGRQAGTRDEPVFFDGIAADINIAQKLNLTAYGGAAVHFYEVDSDWGSDMLGGMGIDYSPAASTSLSLDYLFTDDDRKLFGTSNQSDQLLSLKVWQRFSPSAKAMTKFRSINGDPRDLAVRMMKTFLDADLELNANYFRQFRAQNELSNELSPYYDVLGQSNPYQSYDIKVRKLFGRHYALDIGYFQRTLLESRDENAFNREYKRAFMVFELSDKLYKDLSLAFTGERWEAGNSEFNSAGLDAGYTFKKGTKNAKINAGTYYSLYKYDYYLVLGERTKVRTYYVNGKIPFGRNFSMNGGYEYEQGIEDYQTVKLGMRYDF